MSEKRINRFVSLTRGQLSEMFCFISTPSVGYLYSIGRSFHLVSTFHYATVVTQVCNCLHYLPYGSMVLVLSLVCVFSLFLFGNRYLGSDATDQREILLDGTAMSRIRLFLFWWQYLKEPPNAGQERGSGGQFGASQTPLKLYNLEVVQDRCILVAREMLIVKRAF